MSIYGQKYIDESESSILNFINEQDLILKTIFEDSTSIPNSNKVIDSEAKIINFNTISDKIKKIWDKLIFLLKEKFNKLIENINKIKLKYNFIDDFVKKYGKDINFNKINEMKSKEWIGLDSHHFFMVCKIPTIKDTYLYKSEELRNVISALNEINNCKDDESVQSKYNDFKDKINQLKTAFKKNENIMSMLLDNYTADSGPGKGPIFVTNIIDQSSDGKYYYPTPEQLKLTTFVAENGEKLVKKMYIDLQKLHKNYKNQAKCDKSELKIKQKSDISTVEIKKIKAKYDFTSLFSKLFIQSTRALVAVLKIMHQCAIQTHIKLIKDIKKYSKGV